MSFYVFDLDGTLADCEHRLHHIKGEQKNWRSFFLECRADRPIRHVREVLQALEDAKHRIEIWTGRSDECETETRDWIATFIGNPDMLTQMRCAGDHRKDDVVKREFLSRCDARPDAIFEDRSRVVAMWRSVGIPVFQVADGDF